MYLFLTQPKNKVRLQKVMFLNSSESYLIWFDVSEHLKNKKQLIICKIEIAPMNSLKT